ncbi:MAG TPA: RimK/LysX family protein [bacterium]|nr:RimK/LysX family protein [bacterium]
MSPGKQKKEPTIIGWREWIGLPELGVEHVKVKVDTGARTSALHVHRMKVLEDAMDGVLLRIWIHPFQRSVREEVVTEVLAHDKRTVTSSVGQKQHRYVINTPARIGARSIPIEVTLTNRDVMGFRMLLGRTALRKGFLVNPKKSYLLGKPEQLQ